MPKVRDWTWKSEKSFPLFLHAVSNDDLKTSCRALCKRLKNRLLRKSASARSRSTAFRGKQPLGGTPGLNAAVHAAVAKAFACILQQTTKDSRPCFLNRGRIQRRSQVPRRTELEPSAAVCGTTILVVVTQQSIASQRVGLLTLPDPCSSPFGQLPLLCNTS